MSISRGSLLSVATNSAFRWSPVGEVTESLSLSSRTLDEVYPELGVHPERPPEPDDCTGRTFDCVFSPHSRSSTGRIALSPNGCSKQDKVKVYVRMRPFSDSEKVCPLKQVLCLIGETIVVRDLDQKLMGISKEHPHKAEAIEFKVDYMQDDSYLQVNSDIHKEESQKRMYGALGVPCIESALDGYNTTILAYGQTGSGKTYTMMGDNTKAGRGLIPRLANDLMTKIDEESSNGVLYTVQVSYLEIYQEKIRDLLAEDDVDEEAKPPSGTQPSLASSGMNSHEKVRFSGSNSELKLRVPGLNVEEKVRLYSKSLEEKISSYTGSLTENSYTSSFLNKAALQRQLEAAQKHSKIKCERERSLENPHCNLSQDGGANKVRSPTTKPAFDTVFNKQKIHKHYRTFPTVMEEAPLVRKQNFLRLREHPLTGPFVEGLLWKDVCNWYEMENLMKQGSISRTTAATDMNEKSSRSHAVFSIRLTKNHVPDLFGLHPSTVNYINLVDLAGSEKQSKLCSGGVSGQRTQEESRCINRSLSQLNEAKSQTFWLLGWMDQLINHLISHTSVRVILSLSTSRFVSYRNSILTWLLKESLGGNSRTFMVANISPTEKDLRESINTLRYATTASRIPPPVALDQDPRNKLIKNLKEEICALRSLLSSFTSVKESAPSDQLPSLQGFKVPCLDVGLQVERNGSHNDGNCGKELRGLLEKGSQTENLLRDVGQQIIARTESADAGFQIGLKDGTLDMGNPTALQDSGTVDIGHQTLILNVCACDFGHQASAKDFGVLDVGLQVTLRELGAVTVSQQSTLSDCEAKDVRLHCTPQSFSSVDVGNPVILQHCRDVESRHQRALPHGAKADASLQVMLHNRADIPSRNAVALQDREAVDTTDQITKRCVGEATTGYRLLSQSGVAIDAGNQRTMRDWVTVDAGNQIILRSWGDVDAESQIALGDWGPIDVRLQTSCKEFGAVDVGNQITTRYWGLTDATHQINPGDCGSKNAGHQTRLENHGVDKATDCTTFQLDVTHQIDSRKFGASDCDIQVTRQNPVTMQNGYQFSRVDFGASDNWHQVSWRDLGSSDFGHRVTADDPGGHRHPQNNLKDCGEVVDDDPQADWKGFRVFDFGQPVSWTQFCDKEAAHPVSLNYSKEGIVPDHRCHWNICSSINAQHQNYPNILPIRNSRPHMTFGHSGAVDSEHETAPRLLGPVDSGNQVDWKHCDFSGCRHRLINRDIDGGHGLEPKVIGLQAALCYCWVVDSGQQTDGICRLTSDVGLQTSQTDIQITHAGNQDVIIAGNGQQKVMVKDSGRTDLGLPTWWNGDSRNLGHFTKDCRITFQDSLDEGLGEQTGRKIDKVDELLSLYKFSTHGNQDVRQQPLGRKLERVGELRSLYESRAGDNEDVWLKTAKRKVEKVDKLISLYESRTHRSSSPMASGKALAGDPVNPLVKRNNGAVEVGHPNSKTNLEATNSGCGATPKVSMVKERKAQFEQKTLSGLHFGHQRALQRRPGFSVGQEATPKGIGPVRKGYQTSSKGIDVKGQEFPVDRKQSDVEIGYETNLLDCEGATDVKRQMNLKCLDGIDGGLQTSWNKKVVKEPQLGRKDDAGLESGYQAAFKDNLSPRLRHKSTSTDCASLRVDENGLYTYKAVESWKHFRCRACGATLGNSMVVVSPLVPLQEVTAYVGLQTSWVDLFVTACELQTPTSGCGVSSDVDQITPKIFEAVDESSRVHWEELNPFHDQHYRTCWIRFGESDLTCQQDFPKLSRSLDLEERRPSGNNPGEDAHVGPQNHREACSNCNTGCQNCGQDYVDNKWQHQVRQEGSQGCQNWLHQHEIVLSEPSYMLTESDADTRNPDEDASWNASWANKHQNPQVYRDDGMGLAFLKDVKLKQPVRSNNSSGRQWRDCRALDKNSQAFPSVAIAEVEQQQPARDLGPLEGQNRSMEERVHLVTTETQILNKGDEELFDSVSAKKEQQEGISGILQTQSKEKDTFRVCGSSKQTHVYSYRFSTPAEDLETHRGCQERDQHLDGKLGSDQDSICLSLLREFRRGRKNKADSVPAEEACHHCSLWTLAKLKSRMEWCPIHSKKDTMIFGISLATKGPGLISQPHIASRAEVATQTDSYPENCVDHKLYRSNTFQHICLLWVFVILRIAAPGRGGFPRDRRRHAGERPPLLAAAASGPRKIRILSCLCGSETDEKGPWLSRREYRSPKLKHLRYSGVEPLTFRNTTPFFIQTSGDCSLVRSTRVDRGPTLGNNAATAAAGRYHKIMCGFRSRRDVHFLKEGVNRLGSDRGTHIFVAGLSEDHTEFIYMPADRCMQRRGYVVARLVAPEAMAFLNGLPMLEHKELCTGDVLVLRDLRHRSTVCTFHFFDLVNFS